MSLRNGSTLELGAYRPREKMRRQGKKKMQRRGKKKGKDHSEGKQYYKHPGRKRSLTRAPRGGREPQKKRRPGEEKRKKTSKEQKSPFLCFLFAKRQWGKGGEGRDALLRGGGDAERGKRKTIRRNQQQKRGRREVRAVAYRWELSGNSPLLESVRKGGLVGKKRPPKEVCAVDGGAVRQLGLASGRAALDSALLKVRRTKGARNLIARSGILPRGGRPPVL